MSVTFDGPNKIATLDFGITTMSSSILWSRWVDWFVIGDNSKYPIMMRQVAGDPTSPTTQLGLAWFISNGWKVRPHEADHILQWEGVLFVDDTAIYGLDPFIPPVGPYTVSIRSRTSDVLEVVGVAETNLIPHLGAIWFDGSSSNSNTVVGVDGVPGNPVGTEAAVHELHDKTGISNVMISNTLSLGPSHSGYYAWSYEGTGPTSVLNMGGGNMDGSRVSRCGLMGTQGGTQQIQIDQCVVVGPVSNAYFFADRLWLSSDLCVRAGIHILTNTSDSMFDGTLPTLCFNSTDATTVHIREHKGGLEIEDMSANHEIHLTSTGAMVKVMASCTGGHLCMRGNVEYVDYSGGAVTIVDSTTLREERVDPGLIGTNTYLSELHAFNDNEMDLTEVIADGEYTEIIYDENGATGGVPLRTRVIRQSGGDQTRRTS